MNQKCPIKNAVTVEQKQSLCCSI